jgi:hypothetical protein
MLVGEFDHTPRCTVNRWPATAEPEIAGRAATAGTGAVITTRGVSVSSSPITPSGG